MEDDFALRYVRIYLGVNSRAELVTLAPGLRPERRFAPLARGLENMHAATLRLATKELYIFPEHEAFEDCCHFHPFNIFLKM